MQSASMHPLIAVILYIAYFIIGSHIQEVPANDCSFRPISVTSCGTHRSHLIKINYCMLINKSTLVMYTYLNPSTHKYNINIIIFKLSTYAIVI